MTELHGIGGVNQTTLSKEIIYYVCFWYLADTGTIMYSSLMDDDDEEDNDENNDDDDDNCL